jgi:serine protease Do
LKQNAGLVVEYPLPNSPAAESGLLTDDVIQSFDGQPVNAVYQLQRLAERADLGAEHEIIFVREGKRYKVSVNVKRLPPSAGLLVSPQGGIANHTDTELGMLLAQSTDQILSKLKLQGRQGMLVMSVIAGSRAEKAGINVGTLIVKVDGKPVPGRQEYITVREGSSFSDGIVLDAFLPGGEPQQFIIKLGKK